MSTFAFGNYKTSLVNNNHIFAIQEALQSGITTFYTTPHNMGYLAQEALATVLQTTDEEVEIALELEFDVKEDNLEQLFEDSLENLQQKKITTLFLKNPEAEFWGDLTQEDREEKIEEVYKKIIGAFLFFEKEVQQGRIAKYGIASDSFAHKKDFLFHLPYEDLITMAKNAAIEIGNKEHSLKAIKLPINIVNQEGLECAAWGKKNNLEVVASSPLQATTKDGVFRLATYDESREYYYYLNELLEICENDTLEPLYNLIENLDTKKHKYSWIGEYEVFLTSEILPYIKQSIEKLEPKIQEELLVYIEKFLQEYKAMVKYECSLSTRTALAEYFSNCNATMQECAFEFLLAQENIDTIVTSMHKPSYVAEAVALLNN